jgi:hypothetical protein
MARIDLRRMQSEMSRSFSGFQRCRCTGLFPINIRPGSDRVVVAAELGPR